MIEQESIEDIKVGEIEKFDLRVPRYTSYPTVPNWKSNYNVQNYLDDIEKSKHKEESLSLYLHIPFCIRRCLFCACNVLVTHREDRVERYLSVLKEEIRKTSELYLPRNEVIQLHLGGGTPTHLTPDQLKDLFTTIWTNFKVLKDAELSIEIHPSVTSDEHIDVLSEFNFNRISVGVQDFDPEVQEKLNRFQTFEETNSLIEYSREKGFESVNMDLIYGLPYQTDENFAKTLRLVNTIHPDRIALYSYAHFPTLFRHHKAIPLNVIAKGSEKLNRFLSARKFFINQDYEQIGFDHFSTKHDGLWQSYEKKTLRRNFMGYTTKAGTDLIALGYSGISELELAYAQNSKDMAEYERLIEKYGTATVKGHSMSSDDILHKKLIMDFLCQGEINPQVVESRYGLKAVNEINSKVKILDEFVNLGLLQVTEAGWESTSKGKIFSRIIASVFDQYYDPGKHLFSQSI